MENRITANKEKEFNEWYQQVVLRGEFVDTSGINGCYVMLPNSYGIWENIKGFIDKHLKDKGVQNMYFPIFIRRENLEKEKDHLEGFNPEVAWVTKAGSHEFTERDELAIRPTSECGIYPTFSKMIRSHVDLPLKMNQWCNVVRWEFKDATPFIRSREFLWQEGHTCHKDEESAKNEALEILELYNKTYVSVLAVPVIKGIKTNKEKFSGANYTFTLETFIPDAGKAIQASTAHCLGQNFSKMFNITFQDTDEKNKHVYQNSWGFTTRSIGVALMTHSDEAGAVVPPFVAHRQIVVVPIYRRKVELEKLRGYFNDKIKGILHNFRVYFDGSNKKPGAKYNYWEKMGVPLRIEIGKKELTEEMITICRRDTKTKEKMSLDNLYESIYSLMVDMTTDMYTAAKDKMDEKLAVPSSAYEFKEMIDDKSMCLIPFCATVECEDTIKEKTGAKSLCIPLEEDYKLEITEKSLCAFCGNSAKISCLFGKSY